MEREKAFVRTSILAFAALACTTTNGMKGKDRPTAPSHHTYEKMDGSGVVLYPESPERNIVLSFQRFFFEHGEYDSYRMIYPGEDGRAQVAHLRMPTHPSCLPAAIVFPIRGRDTYVSEALARLLASRGYATVRLERGALPLRYSSDAQEVAEILSQALSDARRIIDWFETRPEVNAKRIVTAGVSLGGIMGATLAGIDERVSGGFFIMPGGGLPEILYDSEDETVIGFVRRVMNRRELRSRSDFIAHAEPLTRETDPLTYASRVDPRHVLLVSARFDSVIHEERTRVLWEGLGKPTWIRVPSGHVSIFPFFWWAAGKGIDHLDRVLLEGETEHCRAE